MDKHMNDVAASVQSGPLGFANGKGATEDDDARFGKTVSSQAQQVCLGIADTLKRQSKLATVKKTGDNQWEIQVGTTAEAQTAVLTNINTNITITANTADAAAVINALNGFFANWRAVAGLIAVGAAWVAGQWLMNVTRQDS